MFHIDDPKVPSIPVLLSFIKLLLELSFDPALLTLKGTMASDNLEVEAWYLGGWAFYLMAKLAHDSADGELEGPGLTGEGRERLLGDMRKSRWLECSAFILWI